MATLVLSGDEVLDGVQEISSKLEVWSSISRVPYKTDGTRMELDDPSVGCWTRRSAASRERTRRRQLTMVFRRTRRV
jgi:hypothetical protein